MRFRVMIVCMVALATMGVSGEVFAQWAVVDHGAPRTAKPSGWVVVDHGAPRTTQRRALDKGIYELNREINQASFGHKLHPAQFNALSSALNKHEPWRQACAEFRADLHSNKLVLKTAPTATVCVRRFAGLRG